MGGDSDRAYERASRKPTRRWDCTSQQIRGQFEGPVKLCQNQVVMQNYDTIKSSIQLRVGEFGPLIGNESLSLGIVAFNNDFVQHDAEVAEFVAKGFAVDAEEIAGLALMAVGVP